MKCASHHPPHSDYCRFVNFSCITQNTRWLFLSSILILDASPTCPAHGGLARIRMSIGAGSLDSKQSCISHQVSCSTCARYRVLAELLEQATHFGMPIPSHIPASNPATPAVGQTQLEIEALPALGINPSTALMHPGFYYYFAAECTEKRRMRFLRLLDEEVRTFRATTLFTIATDFAAERRPRKVLFRHLGSRMRRRSTI